MEKEKNIAQNPETENAKVVTVEALQAQVDILNEHIEKLTSQNEDLKKEAEYYRKRMSSYLTKYDFMRVLAMTIGNEDVVKIVKGVHKRFDI